MEEDHPNFLKEIEKENEEKHRPKLYKESSFKGNVPSAIDRIKKQELVWDVSSSSENDEEDKDADMETEDKIGDMPMPRSNFGPAPTKFSGKVPAKPLPGMGSRGAGALPSSGSKLKRNYDPIPWNQWYDKREILDDCVPLYCSGEKGPIIFCIHGAGHSALSFGPFAKSCKDFARVVSFDIRGHGGHELADETNMPIDMLLQEAMEVLKYVVKNSDDASIIICGHSLGGAIAAKLTYSILHPEEGKEPEFDSKHIVGLFIIDVAEGSALAALPFMEQIVESRPSFFESLTEAIKWGVTSGQTRNLESARTTIPDLLVEKDGKFEWKTNLLASSENWRDWFTGMNKWFLESVIPKTLVIASNDRMDKELTIAQMQGKFQLVSMLDVGHTIQEDAPDDLASKFKEFIKVFQIQQKYNQKRVIKNAEGKEIVIDH